MWRAKSQLNVFFFFLKNINQMMRKLQTQSSRENLNRQL